MKKKTNFGAIKSKTPDEILALPKKMLLFTRIEEKDSKFLYEAIMYFEKLPVKFLLNESDMFNLSAFLKISDFKKKFTLELPYEATKGSKKTNGEDYYLVKLFINPYAKEYVRSFINESGKKNWIKQVPAIDNQFEYRA